MAIFIDSFDSRDCQAKIIHRGVQDRSSLYFLFHAEFMYEDYIWHTWHTGSKTSPPTLQLPSADTNTEVYINYKVFFLGRRAFAFLSISRQGLGVGVPRGGVFSPFMQLYLSWGHST